MPLYSLEGRRPTLPPMGAYWIAPTASLIGDVRLGDDVGVWFGASLRGDNEPIVIGARSNVQEGCTMHTDKDFPLTVGVDCTIGHNVILHGCTIGDGSLIGMGSVVLNGARIGKGCLVGARALVTEGKEFPDHTLIVGSPARVVRPLEPHEIERLLWSAQHYVVNWRRFASGLQVVEGDA